MACFLVPAGEAIVTTIVTKIVRMNEKEPQTLRVPTESGALEEEAKLPFSKKLRWLSNLLWGGAGLLAFEHVWHGEVVPWFPFLTAASNPTDATAMLHEMATAGVGMALMVTCVWAVMVAVSGVIERRALHPRAAVSLGGGRV